MTFQQLNFAVEVAKYESINKAAERLYTHQSNVSNTIKQLEEELGIQIFQRTNKGVSTTNEGREFLSYAAEIMNKKDFVEALYAVRNRYNKQYLSVSSMRAYFLSAPLLQLANDFEQKAGVPTYIRLKKRSFADVIDDVENSQSDIGVLFLPKSQKRQIGKITSAKNLEYVELGESDINVIVREGHPVLASPEPLQHITEYPYVLAEETENFNRFYDENSESILRLFQKPPRVCISINESAASQDIVAQTNAFFLSFTPWRHAQHYQFASVPLEGPDNVLSHFYITRKHYTHTPLMNQYLQMLKETFCT